MLCTRKFEHFLLDSRKVGSRYLMTVRVYVVIEAVLHCRTYAEFHTGEQFLKRFREKVCRRMPERMLAFRVVPLEKLQRRIGLDRAGNIPLLPVDRCGENFAGQLRAQRFGDLQRRNTRLESLDAIVRKCDVYHIRSKR